MALNAYGLQCVTLGLTALGVVIIVLVVIVGAARLLSNSVVFPDQEDME